MARMATVLSLLALIVFCVLIVSLAAAVTYTVVKLIPLKEKPPKPTETA